ncbi:hypothetical protein BH20ACI3_BH20ACI3_16530 [soil metagenome]
MIENRLAVPGARVDDLIREIHGEKVIMDSDLARIYGVSTSRLNEQVKRNLERFPEDFAFRLTAEEFKDLKSQNAISRSIHGGDEKFRWCLPSTVPSWPRMFSTVTRRSG